MPIPGVDTFIVDDSTVGADETATDTLYLLSASDTGAPAVPTRKTRPDTADPVLNAQIAAYFNDGGKSLIVQGYGDGSPLPTLANALALLPPGPGQVAAPEAITSADQIAIAALWAQNKVALFNGASNASDATLTTLKSAVLAGADARGAALFADWLTVPETTGPDTTSVPLALSVAGMIAANDRATGNPNVAAAGQHGISRALGIVAPRSNAAIQTLKGVQINCAKIVQGRVRNYGFRTLADLDELPHWWDFSGSRTIMALRALITAGAEEFVFEQFDGEGKLLGRYESMLRDCANSLWRKGALYGRTPDEAYRVEVVDDIEQIAAGELEGSVFIKTSPFVEHAITNITRRSLTAAV